jgi:tetratricopeptide (TPR) repeat protein
LGLSIAVAALAAFAICGASCGSDPADDGVVARSATSVSHEKIEAALDAADRQITAGEFAKAEAILLELIGVAPLDADAREMLGAVYFQQGAAARTRRDEAEAARRFSLAYESYREAARLRPDVAGLQQSAGEMATVAGRSDDALEHFRRAGSLDPANAKHPLYEAQVVLAAADLPGARAAVDRALAIDPSEPFALATLAEIERQAGNVEAAFERARAAREASDAANALTFRVMEARIHRLSGDARAAVNLLAPLDEMQRAEAGVVEELAAAWSALGEHDRAIEAWAHRFQITSDAAAALAVAQLCVEQEDTAAARRWHDRAAVAGAAQDELSPIAEAIESMERGG